MVRFIAKTLAVALAVQFLAPFASAQEFCPPESMKGQVPDSYFQNCTPPPTDVMPNTAMPTSITPDMLRDKMPDMGSGSDMGPVPQMPDLGPVKADLQRKLKTIWGQVPRLRELVRSARERKVETEGLDAVADEAEATLKEAETALNDDDVMRAGELMNKLAEMNLLNRIRTLQSKMNQMMEQVDTGGILAQVEQMIRGLYKLQRVAQTKGLDAGEINEMIATVEPLYKQMLEAKQTGDAEQMGSLLGKIESLDLKKRMDYFLEHSNALDFKEAFAQIERSIQFAQKAINKGKESGKDVSSLEAMVEKAKKLLKEARDLFDGNASPDEIARILEEIDALPWDETLDGAFNKIHEDSVKKALQESFGIVEQGIKKMDSLILMLKEEEVDIEPLVRLSDKIKSLFARAKALFEEGKYQGAGQAMDEVGSLGDIAHRFIARYQSRADEAMNQLNLAPLKKLPDEFMKDFDAETKGAFGEVTGNVSADGRNQVMQFIVGQGEDKAKELALFRSQNPEEVDDLFELVIKAPEQYRSDLIDQKKKLLDRTQNLESKIGELKSLKVLGMDQEKELKDVMERIRNYNFHGESGDEMAKAIEEFVSEALAEGKSRAEIMEGVKTLALKYREAIEKAVQEKYQDGIIPFKDTDDQEWFTDFVRYVKENDVVSGYKDSNGRPLGEFRPGNDVTVAEILKMGLEGANEGQSEGDPSLAGARNHWAKGYVKKAEEMGLSIVKDRPDVNRPSNRGEVVRMIMEVFDIAPSASAGTFPDVGDDETGRYIEKAAELEIVSGNPDGTFRPGNPINRAEVSKILKNAIELLGR